MFSLDIQVLFVHKNHHKMVLFLKDVSCRAAKSNVCLPSIGEESRLPFN